MKQPRPVIIFVAECSCGAVADFVLPTGVYRLDGPPLRLGTCHGCGREYLLSASVVRRREDFSRDV